MQETKMVAEKAKKYKVIGHLVERSKKNSRSSFEVEIEVDNVVLLDDVKSSCIRGIVVQNETLFKENFDKIYKAKIFWKNDNTIISPDYIAGMTTNKSDIKMLKRLRKNKDYFSFSAVIDPRNLNKFWKIYDVQKIEDVGCIKKIKKLLKEQTVENA